MSIFEKMVEKDPVKYPARMGKKWDIEEVDKLLVSIQDKKSILEIAAEHQRTTGGINSELRKIAANYWFINKKTIEEICEITSLTKEEIEQNKCNCGPDDDCECNIVFFPTYLNLLAA